MIQITHFKGGKETIRVIYNYSYYIVENIHNKTKKVIRQVLTTNLEDAMSEVRAFKAWEVEDVL